MIAAISTDGFITGPNNDQSWQSKEDATFLKATVKIHDVLIMGRRTFDTHKDLLAPSKKQRIVLTHTPGIYAADIKLAYFTDTPLATLLHRLADEKYKNALILGGSSLYSDCILQNLVDDIFITVEPVQIGSGTTILGKGLSVVDIETRYKLVSKRALNTNGTMLEHYKKQ